MFDVLIPQEVLPSIYLVMYVRDVIFVNNIPADTPATNGTMATSGTDDLYNIQGRKLFVHFFA